MAENKLMSSEDSDISNKYYRAYYQSFLDELGKLDIVGEKTTGFRREDQLIGIEGPDEKHIQYKFVINNGETFIQDKGKKFYYEFLIEFDREQPEYSIYYGCRVLVKEGDLQEGIDIIADEWETLRGEVCRALNNTFEEKDFSSRFRITNNADNRFFWPFWITLDPGEDIVDVAVRATKIIASVYKHYLEMDSRFYHPVEYTPHETQLATAFTKDRYNQNLERIKKCGGDKPALYKKFFKGLKNYYARPLIERDKTYEYAWKPISLSNELLSSIIARFCVENGITSNTTSKDPQAKITVPWEYFYSIILSKDGNKLTSIRKSKYNSEGRVTKNNEKAAEAYLLDMGLLKK